MPTYIYQTITQDGDEPEQFEIIQSMKDNPLTHHPETGQPIKRIVTGGYGFNIHGTKIDPFSAKQFIDRTAEKPDTVGALWERSKELSEKRAEKNGGIDPVKKKYFDDYKKKARGMPHSAELVEGHKKAKKDFEDGVKKIGKKLGID